jgi:hypothetical protein
MNSHAEARFAFDDIGEAIFFAGDCVRLAIVDRELHAAGNVHAHRVRNHGVVGREHATNWQTITDMRIGHKRTRHCDWQRARIFHLLHRFCVEARTPLLPRCSCFPLVHVIYIELSRHVR